MTFSINLQQLRDRAAKRSASPANLLTESRAADASASQLAGLATHAQELARPHGVTPAGATLREEDGAPHHYAHAREESAAMYARAREAMHRLGYRDSDAEAQLQDVLQAVPAATVVADLQAIGDERGLPPTTDPAQETHAERLQRRGLPPAVIASLAPRLAQRDREGDDRRSCVECARFGPLGALRGQVTWFCRHPSPMVKHGCHGPDVLFRCDGFLGCR